MLRILVLLIVAAIAAPAAGLAALEARAAVPDRLGSAPAPPFRPPRPGRSAASATASALRLSGGAPASGAPSFLPITWSWQDMAAAAYLGWGVLAHFYLQVQVSAALRAQALSALPSAVVRA
jgi:hypothetical protein